MNEGNIAYGFCRPENRRKKGARCEALSGCPGYSGKKKETPKDLILTG